MIMRKDNELLKEAKKKENKPKRYIDKNVLFMLALGAAAAIITRMYLI